MANTGISLAPVHGQCPCAHAAAQFPSYFHPFQLKPIHLFAFTSVSVNLSILSAAAQFLDSSYPDISIEFDSSIYLDPLYLIPHTAIFCTKTTRLKFQRFVLSFISIPTVCLKGGSMHSQNHTYFETRRGCRTIGNKKNSLNEKI